MPFIYPSYRSLLAELGGIDGLALGLVLAAKKFSQEAGADRLERTSYVDAAARLHRLPTSYVNFDEFEANTARLIIVGVFSQLESYVDRFRRERRAMGAPWADRPEGTSDIDWLLSNLPGGLTVNKKRVGSERVALLDYYRQVRNVFVHSGELAKIEAAYERVAPLRPMVQKDFGLSAPNPFSQICYDDYRLATRLCKYLATDFSRIAAPTSAAELIGLMTNHEDEATDPIWFVVRSRQTPTRMRKVLRGWLWTEYHYDVSTQPEVEADLIRWFDRIPFRRRRGRPKMSARAFIARNVRSSE